MSVSITFAIGVLGFLGAFIPIIGALIAGSVAVLVAGNDQLDQWLMANPQEVFTPPPHPAVNNPANPNPKLVENWNSLKLYSSRRWTMEDQE